MPLQDLFEKYQKPGDPDYHNNMGTLHKDKGQLDDAIREYQKAIALKPNDEMYHCNLASAWARKGMHDEAFREYQRAIEINPDDYLTRFNLGNLYRKLGQDAEAIREYQLAIRLEPERAEAYYNLGNCFWDQGRKQEGVDCYEKALLHGPQYDQSMLAGLRLGAFFIEARAWTKAEGYLQPVWARDREDFMANYLLALIYLNMQDANLPAWALPAKAVIHITAALKARPDDADAIQVGRLATQAFDKARPPE